MGRGVKARRVCTRDFPASVKAEVTDRQGGMFCVLCRERGLVTPERVPLVLDHKQPLSRGGTNEAANLHWLCEDHNLARWNRSLDEARKHLPRWAREAARA